MLAEAGAEEIMRLKNELAIQRALRNGDSLSGYKPSSKAMLQYQPFRETENRPDTEDHIQIEKYGSRQIPC
jgi:hypothetical protein